MLNRTNRVGRAISGVVIFTLAAKLMGFLREIVLSYFFGATGISDAYLISQTIPGTIFQFVGVGLTTCFIPVFFMVQKNKADTTKYTNKILTLVFIFSTVVAAVVWGFSPYIVKIFASGFEGETLYYAAWFTRIGVLSLWWSSMIYVFGSYLNANNVFVPIAFAAIPNSLFIIISIICGAKINIWLLSIGSTLAVAVQLLFILPSVSKTGYKLKLDFGFNDNYIRTFFSLMGPVIIGVSVNEINTLVDRTVASLVAVGGVSALTYANSFIHLIQGGLVQPVATVYYPQITEKVSQGEYKGAESAMTHALELVLGLLGPITAGIVILSTPITELLFARGAFDETAVTLTSTAVRFYAIGICFVGLRELLTRYYYANANTKTPMLNAALGMVVNILLNIVLSRRIGIAGLAIATSVSAIVTSLLLLFNTRRVPSGRVALNYRELGKTAAASLLVGAAAYSVYHFSGGGTALRLLLSIAVSILVYLAAGWLLKLAVIQFFREMIGSLIGKRPKKTDSEEGGDRDHE